MVRLTLSGPGPDDDENVELPLVVAASIDPRWLQRHESAVPDEALDAWRKAGHVVTQREEIWRIDLNDGRQVLLPVEQVEIDYATDKNVF